MVRRFFKLSLAVFLGSCIATTASAKPSAGVKTVIDRAETPGKVSETLILPYAFSTDTMGFNLGLAGMRRGFYQDQMAVGATAFGGEVSQGVMLGLWEYTVPGSQRL